LPSYALFKGLSLIIEHHIAHFAPFLFLFVLNHFSLTDIEMQSKMTN